MRILETRCIVADRGDERIVVVILNKEGGILQKDGSWMKGPTGYENAKRYAVKRRTVTFLMYDNPIYEKAQLLKVEKKKRVPVSEYILRK